MELPTVASLLADPSHRLRLLTPDTDLDRPLRWVAFTELLDPTPDLRGGEFVLTSGEAVAAHEPEEVVAYVHRLLRRGVVGLGFGIDRVCTEVPESLVATAAQVGLPLLEIPRETAFASISRAVTELVAASEREAVQRPLDAQRRLLAAARRAAGAAAVCGELAAVLAGDTVLTDPDGGSLHATSGTDAGLAEAIGDEVQALHSKGLHASTGFTLDGHQVAVYPIGVRGRPSTYLAVRWPPENTELARSLIPAAVTLLALLAEQENSSRAVRDQVRRQVADLMVAGDGTAAAAVARTADQLAAGPIDRSVVQVLVAIGPRTETVALGEDTYSTTDGGTLLLISPAARAPEIARALARAGAAVGTSRPVPFDETPDAVVQARRAVPAPGRVRTYDDLMRQDVSALIDPGLLRAWARELLAPLHTEPELVPTLGAYLTHQGQWLPASRELGVHRHTVRNRVQRIETILGSSLDDPGTAANLVIALRHT